MHVLIDGIVFENSYQNGIWRVFYETIRRTSKDIRYTLLLATKPCQPVPPGIEIEETDLRTSIRRSEISKRLQRRSELKRLTTRYRDAIWHSTYFSLDPRVETRTVVTVHDMVAERYFHIGGPPEARQIRMKRAAILQTSNVIAVSKSTANDFVKMFPDWDGRVDVISNGAEHISSSAATERPTHASSALFIGNRRGYKNFQMVIQALSSPNWPRGVPLTVVGPPFNEMETRLHAYAGVSDKLNHVGRVTDQELASLYQSSICLIFPSLCEGFGIPILEAQSNLCVPVISDIPVFREVAGDGAVFFAPNDPSSLCRAIQQLVRDETVRDAVLPAATKNCRRYSWDDAASALANVYQLLSSF